MERLENLQSSSEDDIDEELLRTQHMSELSLVVSDNGEEWYTLLGVLVLLMTLLGLASVGVVANLVPASSGFVQVAQRSGFVAMVSAMPAHIEHLYFAESIDWRELLSFRSLSFSVLTTVLLMVWTSLYIEGA